LQLHAVFGGNVAVGQSTKPGADAINRSLATGQGLDVLARSTHAVERSIRYFDFCVIASNGNHVGDQSRQWHGRGT
jgi:hypothetical protein